jgi:hypothetical protein
VTSLELCCHQLSYVIVNYTEEIRNRIMNTTSTMPTFYNNEAHAVVARRIYFDIIKVINDMNLGIYIVSQGAEALIAAN